jgi:hypothetical protein
LIDNIAINERHYSIVILKDKSGANIQNIIKKSGQLPMENKIHPADVNDADGYIAKPTSDKVNHPYFNN